MVTFEGDLVFPNKSHGIDMLLEAIDGRLRQLLRALVISSGWVVLMP